MNLQKILNVAFFSALVLGVLAYVNKDRLPERSEILRELRQQPKQADVQQRTFSFGHAGSAYQVEPVAEYTLRGLVVTHNNTTGIGDIYHDETSVDTKDLCVIWGSNVQTDDFRRVEYWSESWTCNYRHDGDTAFNGAELSNNHLITDQPYIRSKIADVRVGDQIEASGLLVNYRDMRNPDFWRRSSTVRTDTGNGACEVFFVKDLRILRAENHGWFDLFRACVTLLIALPLLKISLVLFRPLSRPVH